ncbi:MAG TPA: hypothetical protein VMV35_04390 [Halothiobacillus sp.]|nr:hypothetical protein [Halothiobacillus sp.]
MIDWNEVSAIATAFAAVFTAWMVFLTRKTINQSQAAIKQTREQHMDNFRPVCTLEPHRDEHLDAYKRNPIVTIARGEHDLYEIVVNARLINVGNGPATDIDLSIDFLPSGGEPLTKNLGVVLAAGNEMDGIRIAFSRQIFNELRLALSELPERQGEQLVARESWNMTLTYKDIFGRTFKTHHTRDATKPWTILSSGS